MPAQLDERLFSLRLLQELHHTAGRADIVVIIIGIIVENIAQTYRKHNYAILFRFRILILVISLFKNRD